MSIWNTCLISMLGQIPRFTNEEIENIEEDWPSIVWHIEPDLPFKEQERNDKCQENYYSFSYSGSEST